MNKTANRLIIAECIFPPLLVKLLLIILYTILVAGFA